MKTSKESISGTFSMLTQLFFCPLPPPNQMLCLFLSTLYSLEKNLGNFKKFVLVVANCFLSRFFTIRINSIDVFCKENLSAHFGTFRRISGLFCECRVKTERKATIPNQNNNFLSPCHNFVCVQFFTIVTFMAHNSCGVSMQKTLRDVFGYFSAIRTPQAIGTNGYRPRRRISQLSVLSDHANFSGHV